MTKKKKIILIVSLLSVVLIASMSVLIYYCAVTLPDKRRREEQMKEFQALYAQILADYEEENAEYDDYEIDVAFLGDSLTAGYDVKAYYSNYVVTNRGIGGETTYGLKDRLEVSVLDLKPKICVMLIGGNNPDTMFDDYEDILTTFRDQMPQTKIVLVSHAPTSGKHWGGRNKLFAYNNVKINLLAQKYGYDFVDIYTPMLDLETGEMKAEYTIDGAHFTKAGFDIVTEQIKPVIDRLMANM